VLPRPGGGRGGQAAGTPLNRKRAPLEYYRRPMPRVLGGCQEGGRFLMSEVPLQVMSALGCYNDRVVVKQRCGCPRGGGVSDEQGAPVGPAGVTLHRLVLLVPTPTAEVSLLVWG
jgi:hypothetical protein